MEAWESSVIRNVFLACLMGLMLVPAVGDAQSNKEKAKQLFLKGRAAYKDGQYTKALKSFVEANRLKAHPLMLTNIAKVYEAMENLPKALEYYRRYAATNPKNVTATRSKIARLEATVASWPSLNLSTSPAGAHIRVGAANGPIHGITPMNLRLAPKRHTIILSKQGYKTKTLPILFQAGTHRSMRVPLTADMPVIEIVSTPPGAQVTIDGRMVGQTPFRGMLPIGPHSVVVQQPNQPPVRKQITMHAGHTAVAPMKVSVATTAPSPAPTGQQSVQAVPQKPAAPMTGVLNVDVVPKGSEIKVDGRTIGQSPLPGPITLTQGPHRLEVKSPTGKSHTEVVNIGPGQSVTSSVDLVPSQFNYKLWGWVGMGIGGALVIGGTVAGVMALGSSGDLETCRASSDCLQTRKEADLVGQVRDDAFLADVLLWPGLAVAGTGVLLYLLAPDAPPKGTPQTNIGIVPMRGGAAAFGQLRF